MMIRHSTRSEKKKKGRMMPTLNRAIMSGKNEWRPYETTMQAISEIPKLLEQDILELETIIGSFYRDGGRITRDELEGGLIKLAVSFDMIKWTVVFDSKDPKGKRKYKAVEDYTEGETNPNIIARVSEAMKAHSELPRRKFALEHIEELAAYLEDDNVKNTIENMLGSFNNNDDVMLNAAMSETDLFKVDIDEVLKGLT